MTDRFVSDIIVSSDDIEETDSDLPRKYGLGMLFSQLVCCSCFTTEHKPSKYKQNNNGPSKKLPTIVNGVRKKLDDSNNLSEKPKEKIDENVSNVNVVICSPLAQNESPSNETESSIGKVKDVDSQVVTVNKQTSRFPSEKGYLLPEISEKNQNKKCLIIDLDETLVHSSFKFVKMADIKVTVDIDGIQHEVFVSKRPFVDEFLAEIGDLFECVLFTASLGKYADAVTDFLDPTGIFEARLFREACVFKEGNYVKNLDIVGRDLDQIVILDNSPVSYLLHPKNALQIVSWFDDPTDRALKDLIPYFQDLATSTTSVPSWLEAHRPPESSGILGYPPSNLHWILMQTLSVPDAISIYKQRSRVSYYAGSSSNVSKQSSKRDSAEYNDPQLTHHSVITQAPRKLLIDPQQDIIDDRPPVSSPVARPSSVICLDGDQNSDDIDYLIISLPGQESIQVL